MSIALPLNRLGFGAGTQASRVARSSSWLNRRRNVRRDVEALFQALDGSRSPEAVVAIDSYPVASTSQLPAYTRPDYSIETQSPSAAWKGKSRETPLPDATNEAPANEYVEEGRIPRPLSKFFSVNAPAKEENSDTPIASSSSSISHSSASVAQQLSLGEIPHTPTDAIRLVNIIAQSPKPLAKINRLLARLDNQPNQVQIAALSACLAYPVLAHADWNKQTLRKARNDASRYGIPDPRLALDDVTFYKIWTRLWGLAGETLHIPPDVATRTLKNILSIPPPKKMLGKPESARLGKPLRTLLFLAGLEDNPTLAVSVLGQLLRPNMYCPTRLASAAHLDPDTVKTRGLTIPTAEVNDIVLILQDLLRSGILSPTVVNRFGLSEAISKAPSMLNDDFENLLKQTLLRIILQYYVDHGEHRYISRLARLVQPISQFTSKSDGDISLRDITLLRDAIAVSLQHLRIDQTHAATVARDLRHLLRMVQDYSPNPDATISGKSIPMPDLHRLLHSYFKIVFTDDLDVADVSKFSEEVARLWQSVKDTFAPDDLPQLSAAYLACLLEHMTAARGMVDQDTVADTARMLYSEVHRSMTVARTIDNGSANHILASMVLSVQTIASAEEQSTLVFDLYRFFQTSSKVTGGFSLQGRNLRSLVKLARSHATSMADSAREPELEDMPTSSSILDHFMRTRSEWQAVPHSDYTALAGALLDNGDLAASRQVLQQLLRTKQVPSLEDVEICLQSLATTHPEDAQKIVSQAREEGLLVKPALE